MSGERVAKVVAVVLLGAVVLLAAAWQRGAEYDEQYTLFLTGGTARPSWTDASITAGEVRALQDGQAGFAAIAHDLRATDVHPPLYFWVVAIWRRWFGGELFAARTLSVLSSVVSLALVAVIARRCGIAAWLAVLLTLGCYGFVYTGSIARGFALAQMLTLAGVAVATSPVLRVPGAVAAGLLLGAATFSNYLTAFVACAVLLWLPGRRKIAAAAGLAVWLPADAWFFLAQCQSRTGQFVPFEAGAAVARLMQYLAASVFGGLPLYLGGLAGHVLAAALADSAGILAMLPGDGGARTHCSPWPVWRHRWDCCCWGWRSTPHQSSCAMSRSRRRSSGCCWRLCRGQCAGWCWQSRRFACRVDVSPGNDAARAHDGGRG